MGCARSAIEVESKEVAAESKAVRDENESVRMTTKDGRRLFLNTF